MSKTKRISFKEKYDMYKAGYQFSAEELNEQTDEMIDMSPFTRNLGGNTFLFWMIKNKDSEVPEFIEKYEKILNINIENNDGWTPLMLSVRNSTAFSSLKTVETLVKVGADLNIKNNFGRTALMMASRYRNHGSSLETVKALIKEGADVNIESNTGWTALTLSVGDIGSGWTPIISSPNNIQDDSTDILELLIDAGAVYKDWFNITISMKEFVKLLKTKKIVDDMVKYTPGNDGYKEVQCSFEEKAEKNDS